jgi:hypothetical protein
MDAIFSLTSTITATDFALFQLIQSHWETEDEQLTNRLPRGIEIFGKIFHGAANWQHTMKFTQAGSLLEIPLEI